MLIINILSNLIKFRDRIWHWNKSFYLISHLIGNAFPPAFSTSFAAVYIVPGNFGWGSDVFEAITILAPESNIILIFK